MIQRRLRSEDARALRRIVAASRGFASAPQLPAFDHAPRKYDGPSKEEIYTLRKNHLSPALFHHFKEPLMIVEGKMQYLYDEQQKRYLDLFGGIVTVSVGHCHPEVVKAIDEQNHTLQHTTTIYLNNQIAMYASELAKKLPSHLSVLYFVNSGSEANDLALMLARLHTGNHDFLALRNCYHGLSGSTMGLTSHSTWKCNLPQGSGIKHVLNPDPYRGRFGNDGTSYAADVEDVIRFSTPGKVAGFIAEPIQGVGGSVTLADGYLPKVYEMVRNAGGICISDEVQTGFGRLGDKFWGFETLGVSPDIVTMAKGIGNGLPLAAVATTPEIAETIARRTHLNTFGGNPVSCAAGRAVLRTIEKDQTQQNSKKIGDHLLTNLKDLMKKHDIIGDVRGKGLMLGIELVTDRKTKTPATKEVNQVFERLREDSILIGKGGYFGNCFRIKPPMCLTKADADYFLYHFDKALTQL